MFLNQALDYPWSTNDGSKSIQYFKHCAVVLSLKNIIFEEKNKYILEFDSVFSSLIACLLREKQTANQNI